MTLREKQSLFVVLVAKLILHAQEQGYELTFGEAWRSPHEAARQGFEKSLHCSRLAIDLNLFIDGVYQPGTEAYRELGGWWEEQHELCRWGGRFRDGNHFSLGHEGRM